MMLRSNAGLPRCFSKESRCISHSNPPAISPLASNSGPANGYEVSRDKANDRLLRLREIFKKKYSFISTSEALNSIYSDVPNNLFKDLQSSPIRETQFTPLLCRGFKQSKAMKGFYLDHLMRCVSNSEYQAFALGVKFLERSGMLSIYERVLLLEVESSVGDDNLGTKSRSIKLGLRSTCMELLISICVTAGEPLFGASYALHAKELALELKQESLERVISALSVDDPLHRNYNAFSIFKIMESYDRAYSQSLLLDVTWNLTSGGSPLFANLLFDKFECTGKIFESSPSSFRRAAKALILANLDFGNYHRAGSLWKLCFHLDPSFCETNLPLLRALLEKSTDDKLVEDLLLHNLSDSLYSHVDFVDFALTYFGKREKFRTRFESLTKTLGPPLKRNVLSSLFSAFISQDREEAAEKILQVIFKTRTGINSEDFLVIINKLLSKKRIGQCVEMCLQNDFEVSNKGSMKVLEYLLGQVGYPETAGMDSTSHEEYIRLKKSFLDDFVTKLHKKDNDISVYHLLTATIFTHFSTNISNRATRKLYSNLSYKINKSGRKFPSLISYDIPSALEKFLSITDGNRVQCLEIIIQQANKQEDLELKIWCARELQIAGMPIQDIRQFYS